MRFLLPLGVLAVLLFVSLGAAELVTPRKVGLSDQVRGQATRAIIERYKPNEGAAVILTGKLPTTVLGLYVFDAHGNCVAKDDSTTPQNSVDLALEWVPADATPYCVEVRNAGISGTPYEIVLR
jgi:hypothetical protein